MKEKNKNQREEFQIEIPYTTKETEEDIILCLDLSKAKLLVKGVI